MKHLPLLLAALVFAAESLHAATATVNGITWTYVVSNGKATIGKGDLAIPKSTTGALNIPSSIGGYPVTAIADDAFRSCGGITSATIPDSVTSIGDYAFYDCSGLPSLTIPNRVTSIGDYAFEGCSGIVSVTADPKWAGRFPSATRFTIPSGVTVIVASAFSGHSGLTSVTIPNSVTNICDTAFLGCFGLTSITIPDSVTSIGDYAFYDCRSLTSLSLPGRFRGNTSNMGIPDGCTVTFRD